MGETKKPQPNRLRLKRIHVSPSNRRYHKFLTGATLSEMPGRKASQWRDTPFRNVLLGRDRYSRHSHSGVSDLLFLHEARPQIQRKRLSRSRLRGHRERWAGDAVLEVLSTRDCARRQAFSAVCGSSERSARPIARVSITHEIASARRNRAFPKGSGPNRNSPRRETLVDPTDPAIAMSSAFTAAPRFGG